ncbi:MAG: 50S ribosomal protein L4 [Patescibacteria group bacterium]
MKTAVYNLAGDKVEEIELNPVLFDIEPNIAVIHQVVIAQEKNARKVLAHTKGRSDVRGGGKKPWKQKGTGRARHGSSRSPIWKGGGITFGPTKERNFKVKINQKMKNKALRMILSDKAKSDNLVVVDKWELAEMKTKLLNQILNKLPVKNQKTCLALASTDPKLVQVVHNLEKVYALGANSLNVVDLLKYKFLLISKAALQEIEKIYGQGLKLEAKPAAKPAMVKVKKQSSKKVESRGKSRLVRTKAK